MGKQFKKKQIVKCGNKSVISEVNVFGGSHTDYSGFGFHESDKFKANHRRARKIEEKKVQRGNWY